VFARQDSQGYIPLFFSIALQQIPKTYEEMTNKSFLAGFPEKEQILSEFESRGEKGVMLVNGHFHTPFSFSAFTEIEQALKMAEEEKVQVLGINDFYTTDGYAEFASWPEI
jgi:hypothetical protein